MQKNNLMILKVAVALIIFTAVLLFAIVKFTGTESSSYSSESPFKGKGKDVFETQTNTNTVKPKMRSASTQMNKRDSIELFESTNKSIFAAEEKQDEKEKQGTTIDKKAQTKRKQKRTTAQETITEKPRLKPTKGFGSTASKSSDSDLSSIGKSGKAPSEEEITNMIKNSIPKVGVPQN